MHLRGDNPFQFKMESGRSKKIMKTNVQDGQHRKDLVLHNRLEQQWLRRFANISEVNTKQFYHVPKFLNFK